LAGSGLRSLDAAITLATDADPCLAPSNRQRFVIGLATSPDGFKWTKRGPIFDGGREAGAHDELGAAACQVVSGRCCSKLEACRGGEPRPAATEGMHTSPL
jgi:hypothetical protein